MIERQMTSDEMIVMHVIWNDRPSRSLRELTEMVNETYGFVWRLPRTALALIHLLDWGYLEMKNEVSPWPLTPTLTQREYGEQQRKYYLRCDKSRAAAFCRREQMTDEERERIRKMIDELDF